MGNPKWSVLGRIKRTVKKLKFLLSFNIRRWHLHSILRNKTRRRCFSFNDRLGLQDFSEDVESDRSSNESVRALQRTKSYASSEDDVDRRAEMFIANFRRQLLYERQVSLQLHYYGGNSFGKN